MHRFFPTLFCLAGLAQLSQADSPAAWPAAAEHGGVPYQSVEELRGFYKLSTGLQPRRKGALAMGLGDVALEFGPERRELSIGGIRLELSYPLLKAADGNMLISRVDWVSWVEPIMRPTYIEGRSAVSTVVIDAGHGGHDTGVTTAAVQEAATTLHVAELLKSELEKLGLQVKLTRTGDYFLSDQQRVDMANDSQGAIFLSLHLNSGRPDFQGARVYTVAPSAPGKPLRPGNEMEGRHTALAYALQSALVRQAGATDGGCHRAHFSLLSSISCPAVWVELGYATHEQEAAALASPTYRETLARALAQGIATYAKVAAPTAKIPTQAAPPKVATPAPPAVPKKTAAPEPAKRPASSGSKKSASGNSGKNSAESFRQRARNTRRTRR